MRSFIYSRWPVMLIPVANIITVLYSLKSCFIQYGPSMNTRSGLLVCLASYVVKPVLDFTRRDIVKSFWSRSYHEIIKGWPRSPVKTLSLGIERKIDWPAFTCHGLGTVMSTYSTFDRSTSDWFDRSTFESYVAMAVVKGLPKTKFLNTNRIQWMAVAMA
jgi:hypothetical protein